MKVDYSRNISAASRRKIPPGNNDLVLGAAIDQVSALAGVPRRKMAGLRARLIRFISAEVGERRLIERPDFLKKFEELREEWIDRCEHISRLRWAMAEMALELKDAIAEFDDEYGRNYRTRYLASKPIDEMLKSFRRWQRKAPRLYVDFFESKNERGRPCGQKDNLNVFLGIMLVAIQGAGGRLKFDKNYPDSSLIEALEIIRPHVPFLPDPVPVRAIQSARTACREGLTAILSNNSQLTCITLYFSGKQLFASRTKIRGVYA